MDDLLLEKFRRDGFCVIENFLNENEITDVKKAVDDLIDKLDFQNEARSVFTTYDDDRHVKDLYFLESVDKIRYFYEEGALDKDGHLIVPKNRALNKIGHALHVLHPLFNKLTFSKQVADIFRIIGFVKPVVPQSMYIFKQPNIGGVVTPHVDATFLISDPPAVTGVWIAIDDATIENGCLWFAPGSHKSHSIHRKFVRTNQNQNESLLKFVGDQDVPDDPQFVAVPVKRGSCVLIDGLVWHKSESNTSSESRHAYTFHVFDQGVARWSDQAWLQPTEKYQFPSLFDNVK